MLEANNIMITVWPWGIDAYDWFDNLIIDYPYENLPILKDSENWQETASIIAATGEFSKRGCPSPDNYEEYEDWAKEVYAIMIVYNRDEERTKN